MVEGLGRAAADADRLWQRQVGLDPGHRTEFGVQLANHLVGRETLTPRLETNAQAPLVHRAATHRRHEVCDVRIALHDVRDGELMVAHVLERRALERLGGCLNLPLVLRRDEPFRHERIEEPGRHQNAERERHRRRPVVHDPAERPLVERQAALVHTLRGFVEAAVLRFLGRPEEPAAQHRRERE